MQTKHTSGPWKVLHNYNVMKDNRSIANCGGYTVNTEDWQEVDEENKANAQLIAAAPVMLAALTEGLGIYPGYTFADDLEAIAEILDDYHLAIASNLEAKAQAIRAAIAQARGE